ncbi:restriction endonuclease subunit S [Leuconostoc mesenteroides]|uniref:restriction endonuclease subunit S n=1 Tax=Leuconostoc mesenteroides TaxID=1245 RepID=UPI0032DFEE3A
MIVSWEQRKLGDLTNSFEYGLNASAKKFDGIHKYIRITDIDDSSRKFNSESITSPDIDFSSADNYELKQNDLLFARTGASVGKSYIYTESDGLVYYAGFLIRVRIKPEFDSNFVFQNTFTSSYENFIRITSQRSGQPGVNAKEYASFEISIPSLEEQQMIGSLFKQFDNLITQNERKVNLLKQLKQAYLQKIFSQELRFAGFSNAWKERKLKDVTERVRSNDGRMDLPTLTMSASSGWLDQKDRFSGDISGNEKKNYTLLKKGELSYNHGNSKLAKYGVVFSLKNYEEALVPRVYHSFKALANTSADFIEYMFSTKLPDRELGKLVSSGARMDGLLNINYDDFMNIHITFPNYEEQILMSAFFRKLDNTIALHQQKLNLLKKQKQAYLQKMFI